MTTNLPTSHLAPQSRQQFAAELAKACSTAETQSILDMPIQTQRAVVLAKIAALGTAMTRRECDGCLTDLALLLPRAGLDRDSIERMLDLYFGLMRERHVTAQTLMSACKAYVMAPKKGKARFFPDPGELFELCADDTARRSKDLAALNRAMSVLDGEIPDVGPAEEAEAVDMGERLKALAESLSAGPRSTHAAPPPPPPQTQNVARPTTDADELRAAIARRNKEQAA